MRVRRPFLPALAVLVVGCGGGGGSIGGLALRGAEGYNGSTLRLTGKGEAVVDGDTTFTLRSGNRTLKIALDSANLQPGDRTVIDSLSLTIVASYSEVGVAGTSVWIANGGSIEVTRRSPTFVTLRLTDLSFIPINPDGSTAQGVFTLNGPFDSAFAASPNSKAVDVTFSASSGTNADLSAFPETTETTYRRNTGVAVSALASPRFLIFDSSEAVTLGVPIPLGTSGVRLRYSENGPDGFRAWEATGGTATFTRLDQERARLTISNATFARAADPQSNAATGTFTLNGTIAKL